MVYLKIARPRFIKLEWSKQAINTILDSSNYSLTADWYQGDSAAFVRKQKINSYAEYAKLCTTSTDDEMCLISVISSTDGSYVGTPEQALWLLRNNLILPQSRDSSNSANRTSNVAAWVPDGETVKGWAGFSHRACVIFIIGDRIFEEEYGDDRTLYKKHGSTTIKNMADAKKAAKAFAEHVS